LRYQRFSLYHRAADRYGLTLRPAASYRYVYPLSERDLADLVYYFEDSGDDDTRREFGAFHANRRPGVHAVIQGMDAWNDSWQGLTPPMLSMRDNGDEIVVKDTRNIAAEREHHVKGIAREILLAADRGTPEIHLGRQLKGANTIEIEEATLHHLFLPALSTAIWLVPVLTQSLRAALIEKTTADFVTAARALGATERQIFWETMLPNAVLPTLNLLGVMVGFMIGGAVIVETVYAVPGLGTLMVNALLGRDYYVVQGLTLIFAVSTVLITLMVDLLSAFIDPRVRL
jgi:hypothetical protein